MGRYIIPKVRIELSAEPLLNVMGNEVLDWVESVSQKKFKARFVDVLYAEYRLNRLFILKGDASLADFLELLTDYDPEELEEFKKLGWSTWAFDPYGYQWIDFQHDVHSNGTDVTYYIYYLFEPHSDYLEDSADMLKEVK